MTAEQNEIHPLEMEERKPYLDEIYCQEQNSTFIENAHISDKTHLQSSSIISDEIHFRQIMKIDYVSTEELNYNRLLTQTTQGQTTTLISTDLRNAYYKLNESVNTIPDKTHTENLDSFTSKCSALEINDNHRTENTSNCIISSYKESQVKMNEESTLRKINAGELNTTNTTDCYQYRSNFISSNSIIQEKQPGLFEIIHNITPNAQISTDSVSDSPIKNPFCTGRKTENLVIDTNFNREDQISCISESNIISMKEVLSSYGNTLPQYFHAIAEGSYVQGDSGCPVGSKPTWFDPHKFRLGQKVAMKYFFSIQFAQMLNLLVALSMSNGLTPLIFSRESHTPFKAFKRYLSTGLRVRSWFLDDLWDPNTEGYKNIRIVRKMHESIRNKMNSTDPQELHKKGTICTGSDTVCSAVWSPLHDKLREDFKMVCTNPQVGLCSLTKPQRNNNFVNQTEMAVAQFGFVGLFILYPAYFGAHRITNEELDGFLFLWRCVGYMLGMEDKYNFCNGSLEVIKQRSLDFIERLGKPSIIAVSHDWEHMMRCFTEGISFFIFGISFEVILLYLCSMLHLHTPRLRAYLTIRQKMSYYLIVVIFWIFIRIPGVQHFLNRAVNMCLERAQTASLTWQRQKAEKIYPCQENNFCSCL